MTAARDLFRLTRWELPVPFARLLARLATLPIRDHLTAAERMRAADRHAWQAARRVCFEAHLTRLPQAERQALERALMELADTVWYGLQHHVPADREPIKLWSLYAAAVYAVGARGRVPDEAVRTLYAPFADFIPLEEVVS